MRVHLPIAALVLFVATTVITASMPPNLAPALAEAAAQGPAQQEELSLLFIQQAREGKLVMDANSSTNGSLILTGVARHTVWFADRPHRTAGQVETAFFAGKNFSDGNGDWLSKPNAALYASNPGPDPSNDTIIIFTLTSPVYNTSTKTLTYRAEVVPATNNALMTKEVTRGSLLTSYVQTANSATTPILLSDVAEPVLDFDNVVLFIDNWGWGWGWGHGGGWNRWRWCGWGWGWC